MLGGKKRGFGGASRFSRVISRPQAGRRRIGPEEYGRGPRGEIEGRNGCISERPCLKLQSPAGLPVERKTVKEGVGRGMALTKKKKKGGSRA